MAILKTYCLQYGHRWMLTLSWPDGNEAYYCGCGEYTEDENETLGFAPVSAHEVGATAFQR